MTTTEKVLSTHLFAAVFARLSVRLPAVVYFVVVVVNGLVFVARLLHLLMLDFFLAFV